MNLNLYGHDGEWLMVDCGVSFDEPLTAPYRTTSTTKTGGDAQQKHRVVCADPAFIVERKSALVGIVITHAHEDHVGAIADMWPKLKVPIYATPFTAEVIRRKLGERGLEGKPELNIVATGSTILIGRFSITWLNLTHSIPEPSGLVIRTQVGTVLHTADWKIDMSPGLGKPFDLSQFKRLRDEPFLAVVGDSTNANKPGHSVSEAQCYAGLLSTIQQQTGRVVVACFASNVARLVALAHIAVKTNRYLCLFGRSLQNMLSIARVTGYWPEEADVIESSHAGYLLTSEVLAVATGSQGEPRAALSRLAKDSHPHLQLDEGDTIIFSSIVIPGNEKPIERLVELFEQRKMKVIESATHSVPIHASGHPYEDELKQLYQATQPHMVIPTHGEPVHLQAHAKVAMKMGVKRTYVGSNGDLFRIAPQPSIRRGVVNTGRVSLNRD